jgi:hypothetical protein
VANGAISQDTVEAINKVIVKFQVAVEAVMVEETTQEEEEEVAVTTKIKNATIVTRWGISRRTVLPRKEKNRMIKVQSLLQQVFRSAYVIHLKWI